jgi:hypothetical protein
MMSQLKSRLTYANVIATIALFLALGGGAAFAAAKFGKNVIKARNIAPNAVKASELAKNSVKTPKITNGAVTAAKLASGAVTAAKIPSTSFQGVSGFTNGWSSGSSAPQYAKDPLGFVHLRGMTAGGTDNTSMFQLPAGFRPAGIRGFATSSGFAVECTIQVDPAGNVTPTGCNNLFVFLDPIQFQAEG